MPIRLPTPDAFTVTDLLDADRAADTILGLMPGTGVVLVDAELRIRRIDGVIERHLGIDPEDAFGRPLWTVLPASAWEILEEQWTAAADGRSGGLDWTSLDGIADYRLQFAPLRTPSGAGFGAIMIAQDISTQWRAHRLVERRAGQHAAIAMLGSAALQGTPVAVLAHEAARLVGSTLGADVATVLHDTLVPVATDDHDALRELLRGTAEPLLVEDLSLAAAGAPRLRSQGIVSVMATPIEAIGGHSGAIGAASRTAGAFTPDDLSFLQAMANVLADATERERSAAQAVQREAQLNDAQRLARVGSWEIDLRTGEQILSNQLCDMLDIAAPATDAEEICARVHPDDRQAFRRALAEAAGHAHVPPSEFRIRGPLGDLRILHTEGTGERDQDGRTTVLRGTVQDVTDQRAAQAALERSEERFRKGFDMSPIGMTLISPHSGRFLRVNAAYCRFLDRDAEELLTLSYADVVHPDELDLPDRAAFGRGDRDELITDGRYLRPDGSIVWGSIHASRVLGSDGTADVLFSQVEDITVRRAEQEATRRELAQVAWVREISEALVEDRFELHAQPIVDLASAEVVQHELLLRMRSPTGELIAPDAFLPAAERYGVIREIDRWVVGRGAELAARGMSVEINLSGVSMGDPGLIEEIDRALERTGADPSNLVFEITETAAIEEVDTARRLAERLRARGCRFALDDFGTGFAGISSLKALPLDYLKIDREFVRDLCTSETDRHVITATLDLARAFGLKTIAEGVEDQQTLDLLRDLGVDFAQGYFLGRPAPLAD